MAMKNVTDSIYTIHPYQQALIDKIQAGGFKLGEMAIISSGRRTGKSYLNSLYGGIGIKSMYYKNSFTTAMKPEPKYKFSRAKWYIADFDWVHQDEVLEWCREQFGPHPTRPDAWSRWYNSYVEKIHFRDEKDYAWFILRWS